jgi:hypothetical protein
LLRVAENAKTADANAYGEFLRGHFGRPVDERWLTTSSLYRALIACEFKSFLTTNYDPQLASHARRAHPGCRVMRYPITLDREYIRDRAVYYLHGYISENDTNTEVNVVLAASEFADAYKPDGMVRRFMLDVLEKDAVCFVGCRLRDPPLAEIFKVCEENRAQRSKFLRDHGKPSTPPPRYIFLDRPVVFDERGRFDTRRSRDLLEQEQDQYAALDVTVQWYTPEKQDHAVLVRAFEEFARYSKIEANDAWE